MSEYHNHGHRFPAVSITLNHSDSDGDEPGADFVVIDVKDSEDVSCGFIALDNPSDLILLRAAIDIFIQEHDIKPQAL